MCPIYIYDVKWIKIDSKYGERKNKSSVRKLLKMSHLITFWHFPPIFVQLKLTCLVTLFGPFWHF